MTTFAGRKLDLLYFIFFAIHLPATLLVDSQAAFFLQSSPKFLRTIFEFASRDDPLLANALNLHWFQSFIVLELVFQVPVFIAGMIGLWRNSTSIYPSLAVYGASSATTVLACLVTVLNMDGLQEQLPKLLASYTPFFLIPLIMAVDMVSRLTRLIQESEQAKADLKSK